MARFAQYYIKYHHEFDDCLGNSLTERTVLWSGIVGNRPGMVRKIIPEKFLYITGHS